MGQGGNTKRCPAAAIALLCLSALVLQACGSSKTRGERAYYDVDERERASAVTPTTRQRQAQAASQPLLIASPQASSQRQPTVPMEQAAPAAQSTPAAPPVQAPAQPRSGPEVGSVDAPPPGFILPSGMFGGAQASMAASSSRLPVTSEAAVAGLAVGKARAPEIRIYASPATRAYFASAGIDYQRNLGAWEGLLRRYGLPFSIAAGPEALEQAGTGVVILPSAVALSDRERRAILRFREKGGSVLATWLTGVRNDSGAFTGLDFMDRALDAKVVGNNEADADDNFLMPFGDSPLLTSLPAGQRVWMERVKEWYPLRLKGMHEAARLMDWSRTLRENKPAAVIVYGERREAGGATSRAAVIGYPERLWISSEPKAIDSIARDTLDWLLRQNTVHVAAWPYPYASAMVLAVDAPDEMDEREAKLAQQAEGAGGRASYFVLTEQAPQSKDSMAALQQKGHEIAFLGDRFAGFKDQPAAEQASRMARMTAELAAAGIDPGALPGFRPPMDDYDATTVKLLAERGLGYMVTDAGGSEARLPYLAAGGMLGLPRTVRSIDDALPETAPPGAMQAYLAELDLAAQMGSLSVVSIQAHGKHAPLDWNRIFQHAKARQRQQWLATASQVAAWWRERQRVSARVDASVAPALLSVTITGSGPLRLPVTLLASLPQGAANLKLTGEFAGAVLPRTVRLDEGRAAILLDGLVPGEYRWRLGSEPASGAPRK